MRKGPSGSPNLPLPLRSHFQSKLLADGGKDYEEETGLLGQQDFPEVIEKLFFLHPKQILVQALSAQATAVLSYLALGSKPFPLCIWLHPVLKGRCKHG